MGNTTDKIKAGIKANRYIRQNRDSTLPVMAEWLKIDKEMAAATYESSVKTFSEDLNLPDGGLRLLIDEAKRAAGRSPHPDGRAIRAPIPARSHFDKILLESHSLS